MELGGGVLCVVVVVGRESGGAGGRGEIVNSWILASR